MNIRSEPDTAELKQVTDSNLFTKLACKHFILRSVLIDNRALIAIFSIVSFFSRQEGYLIPIQVCIKSGTSRYWVVAKLVRPCMCPKARGFPIEQGW